MRAAPAHRSRSPAGRRSPTPGGPNRTDPHHLGPEHHAGAPDQRTHTDAATPQPQHTDQDSDANHACHALKSHRNTTAEPHTDTITGSIRVSGPHTERDLLRRDLHPLTNP